MVTTSAKPVLVTIVGPTASGKSALALDLAEKYNGEIICADSRTVYKGMDIGTAKPTKIDRQRVPHHLFDEVDPSQRFTAAEFKDLSLCAINDITARGKLPFLVGGTGLYIDSALFDFQFGEKANEQLRAELERLSDTELQQRARELGITEDQVNFLNRRHLSRAVERGGVRRDKQRLRPNTLVIGLNIDTESLKERIRQRIDEQVAAGLESEVRGLAERYGWSNTALTGIGYKEWQGFIANEQTLEEAKDLLYKHTVQYAKRQRTWFKRNRETHWITDKNQADRLISNFLLQ